MGNWSAGQLERAKYGGAEYVLNVVGDERRFSHI